MRRIVFGKGICEEKLFLGGVAVGVPSVSRRCPVGVPLVSRRCPVGVPSVSRRCPVGVPPVSRWCPIGVPSVFRRCPVGVPLVSRRLADGGPSVSSSVSRILLLREKAVAVRRLSPPLCFCCVSVVQWPTRGSGSVKNCVWGGCRCEIEYEIECEIEYEIECET